MSTLAVRRGLRLHAVGFLVALLATGALAACEDEDETSGGGLRTCGDGVCNPAHCETPVRCPDDCGACTGTDCSPSAALGSCGEACESSCDCANAGEVCQGDYGHRPGVCVPIGCLDCLLSCDYTPDQDGVCASPTCP